MADGRHLENRNVFITPSKMVRFGLLMQNDMPTMTKASKSKPEIEFQYGGRFFSETGSSNNSVNSDPISTKLGTLMQKDTP